MITLTINGKRVRAREGETILAVARRMAIPIPTLCYHPDLTPQGACRLCTVEVRGNGTSRLVTACNYPVQSGIEVKTHSKRVLRARQVLIELLLARCPQATIIQDLARELGIKRSRFKTEDPENTCILCGLCVRTCQEVVGANAIGFSGRGVAKRVSTPFEVDSERCVACGACEHICPTGAIKMEMDRIRRIKQSDTGALRYCRYMRLGLVDFMICSNGFECWRCEFDQAMEDRFGAHPAFALKPGRHKLPVQVSGFTFFPERQYSRQHVWAKPLDQAVKLGLDDLAATLAVDAAAVELPRIRSSLKKDERLVRITAGDRRIEFPSPMDGVVTSVNPDVIDDPRLIWKSPYERGWLVMIEPHDPASISRLLSGRAAQAWFSKQATDLLTFLIEKVGETGRQGMDTSQRALFDDSPLVRRIIQRHWDHVRRILLPVGQKTQARG